MTNPSQLQEEDCLGPASVGSITAKFDRECGRLELVLSSHGAPYETQVPIDLTAYPEVADEIWSQLQEQAKAIAEQGFKQ